MVGDLPSCYLVTDNAQSPSEAIVRYCELMEEWAKAVETGDGIDAVYPVAAAPNAENARELRSRIEFVKREFLPIADR